MKKLIAMIGAVAMSFGLFADATPFSISFETAESEKGVSEGVFNPNAESVTGWTWAGDPLSLAQYVDEVLPYGSGDKARRDGEFDGEVQNDNYLPLETGTDELVRDVGDNHYLDQLVKFTGFEDPQTNLVSGTKIAIWMSEFENEDESTTTNLYVTVGKVDIAGNAEQIALPVAPILGSDGYALNTWYRLTVKSLGNIMADDSSRAGFLIYINGQKVASSDDAATTLIAEDALTTAAKKYMAEKQLFTAIDDSNATFASVGYQGIGAVDDIILDDVGPGFTVETVDVTFADVTGAVIAKVVDSDGTEFDYPTTAIAVKPGLLTVTLEADEGYKMKPGAGTYEVNAESAGELTIPVEEGDFVEVYATKNGTDEYGADELLTMINGLVDGDVVEFNLDSTIGETVEEVEVTYYSFTAGSTITVSVADDVTTWAIVIAGENAWISDYVGTGADFIKSYTFTEEGGTLELAGDIAGALTAPNVEASTDIEVSGTLIADSLTIDFTIALAVGGKVMTKDDSFDDTTITVPEDYELDVQGPDEDELYTYTAVEPAADYAASIDGKGGFDTLAAAFAAAEDNDVIVLLKNVTIAAPIKVANKVTLNIGDFDITPEAAFTRPSGSKETIDAMFVVRYGGDFTVLGDEGVIDCSEFPTIYTPIKLTEASETGTVVTDTNRAKLTVNANLTGYYGAIFGNGNRGGTDVVINGGTITAVHVDANPKDDGVAIYNPQPNSTLVINGGTISAHASAVEIRAGSLTVNGGTLTSTAESFNVVPNGDGSTTVGAAVAVAQHTTTQPISAAIVDGTLGGVYAVSVTNPQQSPEANVSVSLGKDATYNAPLFFEADENATVTKDPDAEVAAPAGYMWDGNVLKLIVATVQANGGELANFSSSAAALAAVQTLEGNAANFPIVATALVDGLEVNDPVTGAQIILAQGETITINAASWVFSGGATITPGKPIALAAGATFTVKTAIVGYKDLFTVPADYEVKETYNEAAGTYTYSAAQSAANVVEIVGGDQYTTLQAAIEAAEDGDIIKLLSDYTAADTESIIFNDDVTFDLNGKTLTLSNAQRDGKKFAMGAEEQGGPDVTITNGVIHYVSGGCGRGFNVFGGTLTVACTFEQTAGSAQPVFDIYSTATVNIEPTAVIDAQGGDVFRTKGDLNTACYVNINGGSITCPANGVFNTAKPLPLTVTLNGGEISYAGGDLIHSGSGYDAQFICNLDDTCGAKFDTDTAKSAGCGLKNLVADGYMAVQGDDEWYTIKKAAVEIVGGGKYPTLQAAIEAAQDGDVIKLLSDYTAADTESIIFNDDVTFDLNGKTLTLSNAQRDGKKFAMGAEEQGGPDVTITNGVIHYVSGGCGRGFNVFGGTLTVACTFEQTAGSAQPVFDIYSTATVNIEPTAVIDAQGGDVFRTKGDLNTACYVNINGGSITCPANGVFNTAKPLPLTVTLNGGEISYAGGDLIHSGSGYDAQFICNLDDTCGAKFDTDTAKSAGCGLKNLVADGYEAVKGEDDWYTVQAIPSFKVTFSQNNEPIVGADKTVLRDTVLTADDLPPVEDGTWDVNPIGAIITCNTNFNYTVKAGPDWPSDWPTDVPDTMKEAFAKWAEGKGTLDFSLPAVQNAFLMNTEVGAVPELKIESISVEGTTATIVVSATGKDLETGINGVLYIDAANDLTNWTTTEVETNADFTDGKATFTVDAAKFMKAGVGFKAPVVE